MATATKRKRKSGDVRKAAKEIQSGKRSPAKKPRREVASAPVASQQDNRDTVSAEKPDPLAVNANEPPESLRPRKAAPVPAGGPAALDLPVSYSGVSIGKQTARMGITVARMELNVVAASEALCNRRLNGRVLLGDDDGALFDKSLEVKGVFDVKGFRCTSDSIGAGLTFQINEIDIATLAKFSKGSGRLIVDEVMPIPGDANHDEFEEEEE